MSGVTQGLVRRMIVERPEQATCEIVLVSGDERHARDLLADLSTAPRRYVLSRVTDRKGADRALKGLLARRSRRLPVLVMLDFEWIGLACERLAAAVVSLKDQMAVECLVTRPPPYGRMTQRLRRMGVFLFDPVSEIPAA